MSRKTLTVVVPSYNIEKYIERSLRSFINIDRKYYSDFEILIINDGSTDDTAKLVGQIIEMNPDCSIRLIEKPNGGHGSTINRGILESQGTYFKVVDGDDWVDKDAFEQLIELLKVSDEDLIVSNYTNQYVLDGIEELVQVLDDSYIGQTFKELPPNRIPMHGITYRTDILKNNHIKLSEGIFYVDIQYTIYPMKFVKSWKYVPLNVYQYLLGRKGQSVGLESSIKHVNHHLTVLESMLIEFSELKDERVLNMVRDTVDKLIDRQIIVNYVSEDRKKLMAKTFDLAKKYQYPIQLRRVRKLVGAIIVTERFPIADFFLRPMIMGKIKRIFH